MPKREINITEFNANSKGLLNGDSSVESNEPKQPTNKTKRPKAVKSSTKKSNQVKEKAKEALIPKTIYITKQELDIIETDRGYEPFSSYIVRMLREKAKII